jgi:putative ABC transport system permease protein
VFLQFIVEAVVTTLGGAGPALLMGLLLTTAPAGTFPFEPVLRSGDYLLALMFALFAGMLSGLLPALAAARMQPVEALRA